MFYDFDLIQKARCSKEEKDKCLELVEQLLALVRISRSDGLLALESHNSQSLPLLLQVGLRLLIDGIEPKVVKEVMRTRIYFGDFEGVELLKQFIIYVGVLALQAGEREGVLKVRLLAFLGDSGDQLEVGFAEIEHKMFDEYMDYLATQGIPPDGVPILDEIISLVSDCDIQRILREISSRDLALALCGSSGKTIARVLKTISFRGAWKIKEEMESIQPCKKQDIEDAQMVMKSIYEKLRDIGEVD